MPRNNCTPSEAQGSAFHKMIRLHFLIFQLIFTIDLASEDYVNITENVSKGQMMFSDTSRGFSKAKDPAVVKFRDNYFLYYTVKQNAEISGLRIGIATSDDLLIWRKRKELKPQFTYEQRGFGAPGAIVIENKVHLFYQSSGNGKKDAICHAWSTDGLTFTRNTTNPIFRPKGDWTSGRAIDADVIEHDGNLMLYYATRDPEMITQMQGVASAPLKSDFHSDRWVQLNLNGPILRPELPWEKQCIEAAALCKHRGKLYMFYAGGYNNEPQQIGCAISSDGVNWRRLFDEPFIPNGKNGEWNSSESGHPYAFTDQDGTTHLFYQGNNDNGESYYLSKVTIKWENGIPFVE